MTNDCLFFILPNRLHDCIVLIEEIFAARVSALLVTFFVKVPLGCVQER